jgi:type II secretory pathway component PulM
MNTVPSGWRRSLAEAWQGRTARERRTLRLAAIVVAALGADLLWTAAEQRPRLARAVERLTQEIALARQLASRIAGAAEPATVPTVGTLPPLPALAGLTVQASGARYRIAGQVDFDAWLAWLANAQRDDHLTLVAARIRQTDSPGLVQLDGELERAH